MTDAASDSPTAAQLIHEATTQGWPPGVVDLVATLAVAGIPHHVVPARAGGFSLSLPSPDTTATGIDPELWQPSTLPGCARRGSTATDAASSRLVSGSRPHP